MAEWKKISVYSVLLLSIYISIFGYMMFMETQNRNTKLWGIDFAAYYSTGQMVTKGDVDKVYDYETHQNETYDVLNRITATDHGWYYPPTFLLVVVPLSFLPYNLALILWLTMSFLFALYAIYLLTPGSSNIALIFCGFPAVLWNLRWGQNGFLSAGLLGLGLAFLERNPVLSGAMFGLLTYKPQIALFPLFLLLITKKWRVLRWSVFTALVAAILSSITFGINNWILFITMMPDLLKNRSDFLSKYGSHMHLTIYSMFEDIGKGKFVSHIVLLLIIIGVGLLAAWVWEQTDNMALNGSILVLGIPLSMPYLIQYDLVILGIPLVLLAYDFWERGYRKAEVIILIMLWLMPLINWYLALWTNIQICQSVLIAITVLIVYRSKKQRELLE